MTERPPRIINPCWLHEAASAQACCADWMSARLQNTIPLGSVSRLERRGRESRPSSAAKNAKRSAENAVATTVRALSP